MKWLEVKNERYSVCPHQKVTLTVVVTDYQRQIQEVVAGAAHAKKGAKAKNGKADENGAKDGTAKDGGTAKIYRDASHFCWRRTSACVLTVPTASPPSNSVSYTHLRAHET